MFSKLIALLVRDALVYAKVRKIQQITQNIPLVSTKNL